MKIGNLEIESYRGRAIRFDEDVWVYRNLMRTDGPWYSIMQRGCVAGHARWLALRDVRFVVRAGGRARAREERVKNVHAFVVGRLTADLARPSDTELVRVSYSPFADLPGFTARGAYAQLHATVGAAAEVWLTRDGCHGRGLEMVMHPPAAQVLRGHRSARAIVDDPQKGMP